LGFCRGVRPADWSTGEYLARRGHHWHGLPGAGAGRGKHPKSKDWSSRGGPAYATGRAALQRVAGGGQAGGNHHTFYMLRIAE